MNIPCALVLAGEGPCIDGREEGELLGRGLADLGVGTNDPRWLLRVGESTHVDPCRVVLREAPHPLALVRVSGDVDDASL